MAMTNELKIEFYLSQLDRALAPLPVSRRAEVVTEIKSHIHEKMESDPSLTVEKVLADLGTAYEVAARQVEARGLRPVKPMGSRVFKWVAIGTVAFFGLIFAAGMFAIWYLSPLVKVDEARGHVELFGGLIDINEELCEVKVGDMSMRQLKEDTVETEGSEEPATLKGVKRILIPFNTAKLKLAGSADGRFQWSCTAASSRTPQVTVEGATLTLNLDVLSLAKCEVVLPTGLATEVKGVNGHLEVQKVASDLSIALDNGRVKIEPLPAINYDYDIRVKNGLQDVFPRSKARDAVKVQVRVVNGVVKKDE